MSTLNNVEVLNETVHINDNGVEWDCDPVTRLVSGLSLSDVVSTGAVFDVNPEDICDEPQDNELVEEYPILSHHPMGRGLDSDDEDDEGRSQFEHLALKMTNVDAKGYVKKRIIQEGTGEELPDNALVTIHYEAYLEYQDEPYDTSYNSKARSFRLGTGQLLPGLEMGIISMKNREVAQLLVDPLCGYGRMGVPDLIPPNSTLMFRVEIMKFIDSLTADLYERMTKEERKKFSTIKKVAENHQVTAKKMFKMGNFKGAIKGYNRAVNLLEAAQLNEMSEQEQQQRTLIKLYTNLAICYNARDLPQGACRSCQRIKELTADKTFEMPVKGLFQHGRALFKLGEYNNAKIQLLRAKKMEPNNRDIAAELTKIEEALNNNLKYAKTFSQKVMGTHDADKTEYDVSDIEPVFVSKVKDFIRKFKESADVCQVLPDALSAKEVYCFEMEAKELGMLLKVTDNGVKKTYSIVKE